MNLRRFFVLTVTAATLTTALAIGFPVTPPAHAYPEPEIVSPSWQLDFSYQKPRPIAIQDVDGMIRWFWFMPYKVVNHTGQDVLFIPEVTIATDTGRIFPAGNNIPASLFPRIKQQLRNPLLESPINVVGRLLQGEDFAKESVIIWPAFRENVDDFTVFISGLSGETRAVPHPRTGEPVLMRRTLMLRFGMPGDPASPQDQPVVLQEEREVMR